eukprot:CAMPEP_0184865318 /NCGR_PEP_ID=MMETSP0580-20130426/17685_1 /TAXON_ID=1118495 /ORGANISM="Dactyliosolen fragilissimus" /LENGTH=322 /DNA_ID=CAMNT_0027364465 /DNA_START=84 /DNA_END=1052 /DNA_ORIENTATION=-
MTCPYASVIFVNFFFVTVIRLLLFHQSPLHVIAFQANPIQTKKIKGHSTSIETNYDIYHTLTARYGWLDSLFPQIDPNQSAKYEADRKRNFPEQYPATYEMSDAMVESDDDDDIDDNLNLNRKKSILRPLLKQTQLEMRPLKLVYDANQMGWSAQAFHKEVDGKGASIVLAQISTMEDDHYRYVGGYNPKGWASLGGARPSVAAFLFYGGFILGNEKCDNQSNGPSFQKLRKVGGGGLACGRDDPSFGISFGPDSLVIGLQNGRETLVQSKLGPYFERGPDNLPSLFEGGATQLIDLKVYAGIYGEEEDIPYSGAVMDMTSG